MGLKEISAILLFLGFVSGCASIGPGTVARDIMFLFTLTDTGEKQGAPVITIPAG